MLRVGLIGFGGMGKTHSRVYSVLTEKVEYVRCCGCGAGISAKTRKKRTE